jgi:sarcosine oxidase, subunit delta
MLLIQCPYCGLRPELEFAYGGQAHVARPADPSQTSDDQLAEFLYLRNNTKGVHAERWRHVRGCARFFNALRDTTTDTFLATYRVGEPMPVVGQGGAR